MMRSLSSQQSGFTLVEALVVTGLIVVLFGLGVVGLGQPQTSTDNVSAVETLVNDLKAQQTAAMAGTTGSSTSRQSAGVYVQAAQYTLFTGSSYSAADSYNYVVPTPSGVSLSSTFPGGIVLFNKGAGDVSGFTAGNNTITVTSGSSTRVITITRYGAITVT
jgi:type II secretory pathway pseudopilin PulG